MKPDAGTALRQRIMEFIKEVDLESDPAVVEPRFNALALELFAYQFEHVAPYRKLCLKRGLCPGSIESWRQIPAVSTTSFKSIPLFTGNPAEAAAVFYTSGTTRRQAGKHHFKTLDIYKTAALRTFKWACMPDLDRISMLLLGPSREHFPNSSLGHMFSWILESYGKKDSIVVFHANGLDTEAAISWLESHCAEKQPVMLLATSLALWQFVTDDRFPERMPLPEGSRVLDTGGYKTKKLNLTRRDFVSYVAQRFGLAEEWIFNEYGMTEMSSQYYETIFLSRAFGAQGKYAPPWLRSLACDPDSLKPLPAGETGVLRHFDLANVDSIAMLQTEDIGSVQGRMLALEGRLMDAEPRGCSLLAEEIFQEA